MYLCSHPIVEVFNLPPTVTVQFSSSGITVDEGASIDIQLTAEGTFDQDFTVNLVFTDGKASKWTS